MKRIGALLLLGLSFIAGFNQAHACTPWTDADLAQLANQKQSVLIYLWSPGMPLSVRGLEEIFDVARDAGLTVLPLAAPYENPQELWDELGGDPKLCRTVDSSALNTLGALNHYPTIVIMREGELLKTKIQGYEQPRSLTLMVSKLLHTGAL